MSDSAEVVTGIKKSMAMDPQLDLHAFPLDVHMEADGAVVIEGEVQSVAAKRLALERAAMVPGAAKIVDRIRVQPTEPMSDGEIGDLIRDALVQDSVFRKYRIREERKGAWEMVSDPDSAEGTIDVSVHDGAVTLDGSVPGLGPKRLAGVLAWWVPGSRDVINGLAVESAEQDNDIEIADAVRIALEKDPLVDAGQIRIWTRDRVVTLRGVVRSPAERDMAEADAWYVFGVDRVQNEITVQPIK